MEDAVVATGQMGLIERQRKIYSSSCKGGRCISVCWCRRNL